MKRTVTFKRLFYSISILITIIITLLLHSPPSFASQSSLKEIDMLTLKLSKNYTNKFCNGIGFGLSKESALTFAIKENIQTFKNRKGISQINFNEVSDQVALGVIDKCGPAIGLSGKDGIEEFKDDFIAYNNQISQNSSN
tara:strand:- start:664 stop:1083 length:420 start_codon:yes stop_codon:yes gene_type:complete